MKSMIRLDLLLSFLEQPTGDGTTELLVLLHGVDGNYAAEVDIQATGARLHYVRPTKIDLRKEIRSGNGIQ